MVDMAHFAGLVAAGLHPSPGAARPRHHHHHAQDPRRPARRRHPDQRPGDRQEDQLRGVPRPAGRPAGARHRRQGRGLQDGRRPVVHRARRAHARAAPGSSPSGWSQPDVADAGDHGAHRRHRRAPGAGRPARLRPGRPGRPRTGCTRSASPSTATPCRSTRARRWSPPACGSAPRRWPPAASATRDFAEVADIIAAALTAPVGDLDPALAESLRSRVAALAASHPLYAALPKEI